ncbi:MAG: helix-turn-helix domain-containing protein [Paludibacter sp.]|nr:helix-turn-helix domain-containing protein [Paludibacter sp.]
MNFKEHFEKFEADIRKKMLDDETIIESLNEVSGKHNVLLKKLDCLIASLSEYRKVPEDPFFTNDEFMDLMSISIRTAQLWRDQGLISYSQISGKIYYRMSDIQKLLDDNYHKSIKKARKP